MVKALETSSTPYPAKEPKNSLNYLGTSVANLRKETVRYYQRKGINSPESLKILLKTGLDLTISDKVICGNPKHTRPFRFLWDMYSAAVNEAILWTNRAGGKSYLGGLITWLRSASNDNVATKILGGSFEQSAKSYMAMTDLWDRSGTEKDMLKQSPQITKTNWLNGSNVEILTASHNSVRGPHPHKLILDEVEEMDFKIYEAALSQPQGSMNISSSTLIMSTMHKSYGMMNYLLENYKKMGFKLYNWCVFEVLESCKDYVCSTCPIRVICPGEHMKQAEGHYCIEDMVKKMKQLSRRAFNTEWLCQSPTREGLVYQDFNEDNETTVCFDKNKPVDLGIDWGGTNPFAVTVWQVFDGIDVQIDEIYLAKTSNKYVLEEAKTRQWWKNVKGAYCDSARPDLIKDWQDALRKNNGNSFAIGTTPEDVMESVDYVESRIKPLIGPTTLKVSSLRCTNTLREYDNYHMKEQKDEFKPVKDMVEDVFNHAMDGTRYYLWGKYKRTYHYEGSKDTSEVSGPMITSKGMNF